MPTFIYKGKGEKRKVFSLLYIFGGRLLGENYAARSVFLHTKPKAWYHKRGEDKNLAGLMSSGTTLKPKTDSALNQQIKNMEHRETKVYQQYFNGCTTFEKFIENLRNLFSEKGYGQDKEILRNFKSENARAKLKAYFGTHYVGASNFQLKVEIEPSKITIDLKSLQKNLGEGITITPKPDDKIELNIGIDKNDKEKTKKIKQSLNLIFNTRFDPNSSYERGIKKFLNKVDDRVGDYITIIGGVDDAKNSLSSYTLVGGPNSPFRYTEEDISGAANNSIGANDINSALKEIKQFFLSPNGMNIQNGSPALRAAFELTWRTNIEAKFSQAAFFMKGGTLNYLIGALGEFQTALINNYILRRAGRLTPKAISRISETIGQRQQSKVDVTVLKDIGIQVKNYDLNIFESARRGIMSTTNTPKKFLNTLQTTGAINKPDDTTISTLESFIVNYAFSADYRTLTNAASFEQRIKEIFETYYAEMYSFAVQADLDDTVLFYSIAGEYLIPASRILKMISKDIDITGVPLKISWPKPYSYEYFYPTDNMASPPWKQYWEPRKSADPPYIPTEEQSTKINNLLSTISFSTGFQFTNLKNFLTKYSMFD